MKLEYYAKIVNAVDEVRDIIGEDNAEVLIETMERTYDKIEEFCKSNISGFNQNGELVPIIKYEDGVLTQEIDLKINGKSVEDEKYAVEMSNLLKEAYNDIGWEMEEDEN
jgi:N-methylhydantoinase B/oxoprolinase/acetone carboxylase alpha subunit